MNEIQVYEQTSSQVSIYSDTSLYADFAKIAENLSKSELVPMSYRNKPESCLLAIDIARQIGCKSPIYVMQNLHVIGGKTSWSAQYCGAVVRTNFKNVRLEWKKKDDPEGVGCRIVAIDPKNGDAECLGTWVTMKMANEEGWINKNGSKWKTMPLQMLQYRAYTFFARIYCPEKLLGIYDEYENREIEEQRKKEDRISKLDSILEGEVIKDSENGNI